MDADPLRSRPQIHPLTLRFLDPEQERMFRAHSLQRLRFQSRMAILVGLLLYALSGVLDPWFVPAERLGEVWLIRAFGMSFALAVFLFTFSRHFDRVNALPLALVGVGAGATLLAMLLVLPPASIPYYCPGLVLITFWTFDFLGIRLVHAAIVNLLLLATYNLLFGVFRELPAHILAAHDFFIASANVIGGFAGYLLERQRRALFLRTLELDRERIAHLRRSLHDQLTGLPNRDLLHDRLRSAISQSHRDSSRCAAFYLDLDGFKPINDTHGHEMGDRVLKDLAHRLQTSLRETDTVARLGGDEFFLIARDVDSLQAADMLAAKILACVEQTPMAKSSALPALSASIGICLFPYDGCTPEDILRRADHAMYEVKRRGKRGWAVYGEVAERASEQEIATQASPD
jgi:diguanylate cyclase (GGDEF)-like protein